LSEEAYMGISLFTKSMMLNRWCRLDTGKAKLCSFLSHSLLKDQFFNISFWHAFPWLLPVVLIFSFSLVIFLKGDLMITLHGFHDWPY
jgi:hypothetical protein